jgi:hypothetical protein
MTAAILQVPYYTNLLNRFFPLYHQINLREATMSNATVYAVMRATIEIPVRASNAGETVQQLYEASKREAEGILRNRLPDDFRVVGGIAFSHAIVRGNDKP